MSTAVERKEFDNLHFAPSRTKDPIQHHQNFETEIRQKHLRVTSSLEKKIRQMKTGHKTVGLQENSCDGVIDF